MASKLKLYQHRTTLPRPEFVLPLPRPGFVLPAVLAEPTTLPEPPTLTKPIALITGLPVYYLTLTSTAAATKARVRIAATKARVRIAATKARVRLAATKARVRLADANGAHVPRATTKAQSPSPLEASPSPSNQHQTPPEYGVRRILRNLALVF
jgi:hypothetical protein